jgi:hypothetical protein
MPTELARRTAVDVSVDNITWFPLLGKNDVQPTINPTKQDATTYESNGWGSMEITLQTWSIVVKLFRISTGGVLNAAQQLLVARIGQFGSNARIYVRWYDSTGRVDQSWSGLAIVEMANSKTGVADLDEDTFTFTGDGILTPIANPYVAASIPLLSAASPNAQSVGKIITLSGSSFTGTTAITIGGVSVAAGAFTVQSDSLITFVVPAGTAGSAPIIVTNGTGASASFPYTRGA